MKIVSSAALTKLIQLIKSGFISVNDTVTTTAVTLATVATSGDYTDLSNKPTIPTDTSDLTNNAGFITSSALSGYATETWVGQQGYLTSSSIANMQTTTNLVTSISSSSTDTQYPSAKCVYDIVGDIETLLSQV